MGKPNKKLNRKKRCEEQLNAHNKAEQKTPPAPILETIRPWKEAIDGSTPQKPHNQHQSESKNSSDIVRMGGVWSIILTGALVLFAGLQWWTMHGQLKQMEGQLNEMKGTSAQTDRIIAEATRISGSLERSVMQSKESLNAIIEASRYDQRAWCTVTGIDTDAPINNVVDTAVHIKIRNSGRTPAINIRTGAGFIFSFQFPLPSDFILPSLDDASASKGVLGSQDEQKITPIFTAKAFNDWVAANAKEGSEPFYIYFVGSIEYEDGFNRKHRTTYCYYVKIGNGRTTAVPHIAPTWNYTD